VWKRLQHPNIVPFLGVPAEVPPFEVIYDWMENGRIDEYVRNNPEVDRIDLVGGFVPTLIVSFEYLNGKFHSCGMWRMGSGTSTRVA